MKVILHTRPFCRMGIVTPRLWLATVLLTALNVILQDHTYYQYISTSLIIDAQLALNFSRPQIVTKETERDSAAKTPTVAYHTVFSTECSSYHNWQSYVFFYHILRSGQEGNVTRIVSGCNEEDAIKLQETFDREIAVMAPGRFHLHLTPDFTRIKTNFTYIYFNKPYGLQHWMEQHLGYPSAHQQHDDTIVILMDPDQILFRPFTNDFTNSSAVWRTNRNNKLKVEHGSPFAQLYGYNVQWKTSVDIEHVFQGPSPVSNMTDEEASKDYIAIGPPYIVTAKDMYTIVMTWAQLVPRVLDDYPFLLAEMYGYNLAAAHHGLLHTTAISFMVSNVQVFEEGWSMVDQIPAQDVCHHFPLTYYPHVFHYCQEYHLGKWFFGKTWLRNDFMSCEAPLLVMPPKDLATRGYTTALQPRENQAEKIKPEDVKKEAFMVCTIIRILNEAAIYYKDHHCTKENVNYTYAITFHDNMTMP